MLANEEAADHYARALDVLERSEPEALQRRCDLLLKLGEARVRSGRASAGLGRLPRGGGAGGAARRRGRAGPGGDRRVTALRPAPRSRRRGADRVARAGLGDGRGRAHRTRFQLLTRLCGALYFSDRRARCRRSARRRRSIAHELGDPQCDRVGRRRPAAGLLGTRPAASAGSRTRRCCSVRARGGGYRADPAGARLARRRPARARRPDAGSTPRSRRSRPAPNGCASRCTCGTPRSGARCSRCLDGRLDEADAARRRAPCHRASAERGSPRPSTTRPSCWRSAANRGAWPSSRRRRASCVAGKPAPAGVAGRPGDAAVRDGAPRGGALRVHAAGRATALRRSPRRRLDDR